jgi:hypothetical protein
MDTSTKVPLLPAALTILEKYSNDPVCNIKGKSLPVSTNQKLNAYLKRTTYSYFVNSFPQFLAIYNRTN